MFLQCEGCIYQVVHSHRPRSPSGVFHCLCAWLSGVGWAICRGRGRAYDTGMEQILMHICCAPDATVPVLRLRAKGYEPVGFFYDPNICLLYTSPSPRD